MTAQAKESVRIIRSPGMASTPRRAITDANSSRPLARWRTDNPHPERSTPRTQVDANSDSHDCRGAESGPSTDGRAASCSAPWAIRSLWESGGGQHQSTDALHAHRYRSTSADVTRCRLRAVQAFTHSRGKRLRREWLRHEHRLPASRIVNHDIRETRHVEQLDRRMNGHDAPGEIGAVSSQA